MSTDKKKSVISQEWNWFISNTSLLDKVIITSMMLFFSCVFYFIIGWVVFYFVPILLETNPSVSIPLTIMALSAVVMVIGLSIWNAND